MRLKDLPVEVQINFKTNLERLCVALFDPTPALTSEPAIARPLTWPTEAGTTNQFTIGARIRQLRKERMLTQSELAKSVDVQPNLVTMWENSTTEPRAKHIIPLANALKCDPMWLLTGNPVDVKPAQPAPVNIMKGADLANIGVRINSRRNEMGMSPLKLAEKIDTSGAMILEWETGKAIPHSDYIDRLAKALNTTVTWLMTGKDITSVSEEENITSPDIKGNGSTEFLVQDSMGTYKMFLGDQIK
ncbi:helix-turn-helix domain-containing protein [Salmonella enterica subsp. enterica serovar Newport]|nr:helix-turn-helix domain-containing protein [Salmonella enterica subsp. enterica serovar Newport]EJW0497008.1 helix-turn-helix domain-containing protein [Salmonella enterica subsp. enterica serovar Newport]ELA5318503.1 helix-turn-helix domain-containing protein [Salmonella enterica subsp. enterica serovar Newport]